MTPLGLFNKTAYRVTVAESQSTSGALTKTPTESATGFRCAFQSTGSGDGLVYDREKGQQALTMFCPTGTTLDIEDYVVVDSVKYRVLGFPQDEAGRGSFLKVFVERKT